uniref:Uncharacterized protein n=1 Tax=Aureoumbra lagunensis TaxID=44058 RepID=A0A7S3JXW9_9STRA|mmetsp:Transcript_18025/g.23510  ORF Transcript_18025/g.23510 Transcript_18025/m.23510 type:complete len:324 (+) Transcript_18025:92-1063(+)
MANNGQHHEFIEFVCKPVEDLYITTNERRSVRIPSGQEYRCSMLREQHFSSLFRHYGKHNGVDKETLVFFFTEELMRELEPNDTPKSVHLKKNDVIVIRHRRQPQTDGLLTRFDLNTEDTIALVTAFPKACSLQSADGRTCLHHLASRASGEAREAEELALANRLLLFGSDPRILDNYGRTAADIAKQYNQRALSELLAPNEFKKQMAVIRAHFLGQSAYASRVVGHSSDSSADTAAESSNNITHPSTVQGLLQPSRGVSPISTRGTNGPRDIFQLKRACTSNDMDSDDADDKHTACLRFLFSSLAHGNQARNFKRVVCFLYA